MARVIQKVEVSPGDIREVEVEDSWTQEEIVTKLRAHFAGEVASAQPPQPQEVQQAPEPADLPAFDEASKPETAPSTANQLRRQVALTQRAGVQLATDLPTMIGDAANSLLNLVPGVNLGMPSQVVDQALSDAGLPEPATPAERIVNLAARSVGGVGAEIKAAQKLATGNVRKVLTEATGTQAAAAAAGGASAAGAAEADLGIGGQIVATLVGGIGGGAAAAKAGRWADARVATGKPVSVQEAETVSKAMGLDVDSEQLAESLNQAMDARTVEASTLQALVPDLKKVPVEVARAQAHAAKKEFTDVIRGAFESEAELNDFVNRTIRDRQEDAVRTSQLPVDVQRARARLGVDESRDARLIEEIKVRQDAIHSKLEADRTVPPTQPEREAAKLRNAADNADILKRDANTVRTADDKILGGKFLQKTAKRMEAIAPRVAIAVRRSTAVANRNVGKRVRQLENFTLDAGVKKAMKSNRAFKAAVLNGDDAAMDAALPGSGALYRKYVAPQLKEIADIREANGLKVRRERFFPRAVTNLSKLRKTLSRAESTKLDDVLRDKAKAKGRPLDENEIAGVVGQFVGGHKVSASKGRTILDVTENVADTYQSPQASLYDYIHKFEEDMATQAFFKNTLNEDVQLTKNMDADGIGKVLTRSMQQGELSSQDVLDLAELLDVHFGVSKAGPPKKVRLAKDIFTGLVLGYNPFSTITQLADFGITAARFGPVNTMKGIFGKNVSDIYESGLRNLASETRVLSDNPAKFARAGLKSFGFEALDRFANKAAMNAAFRKRAQLAAHSPNTFRKQIEPLFGKADTEKLIADLNAGRYSDDVATLMAHDVADIRPISREDMPLHYNQHPKGRLAYSLLSWGVNQMNFVRNKAIKDILDGVRTGNVKQMSKGTKAFVGFTAAFAAANTGTQAIKDFIKGEDLTVEDPASIAIAALPFGMSSRFALDAFNSRSPSAAVGNILPIIGIPARSAQQFLSVVSNADVEKVMKSTPATKGLWQLITGPVGQAGVGLVGMGLSAVIPAAEAMTHQAKYSEPKVRQQPEEVASAPAAPRDDSVPSDWTYLPPERVMQEGVSQKASDRTNKRHMNEAKDILEVREGNVPTSYVDSEGFLTGGIGHLMSTAEQAKYPEGTEIPAAVRAKWFEEDSKKAFNAARRQAVEIGRLDMIPVLTSVNFQLGTGWTQEHKNTWRLMKEGKFEEAAVEAADSLWFKQTPVRVKDLQDALIG